MTRPKLTDELIRDAMAVDPDVAAPPALLFAIRDEVRAMPQPRTFAIAVPRLGGQARWGQTRWVLVAAATLLLVVGMLLLGGGGRNPLDGRVFMPAPSLPWPTPGPEASHVGEFRVHDAQGVAILGAGPEEAWIDDFGDLGSDSALWHRTAAGWTGPLRINGSGIIRSLASLPDGRLAVAADGGVFVSAPDGWTRVRQHSAMAIAADASGVLWVDGFAGSGDHTLLAYRETSAGWVEDWSGCSKGGASIAVDADGSVWTSGFLYAALGGIARVKDRVCTDMSPKLHGSADEVAGIAAMPAGGVAAAVLDPLVNGVSPGGHIIEWRDGRWIELRAGPDLHFMWNGVASTSDGSLWTVIGSKLTRYADGTWTPMADAADSRISASPDGTIWYLDAPGLTSATSGYMVAHLHPATGASNSPQN
jgi:hypothetical protein